MSEALGQLFIPWGSYFVVSFSTGAGQLTTSKEFPRSQLGGGGGDDGTWS